MNTSSQSASSVSIIIRTLNESAGISQLLQALESQSIKPREVIVVDSGSSDNTVSLAREHMVTVLCLTQSEFSYGRALNLGFASATGEIVVALSAHALPKNNRWLYTLIQHFADPKIAAASSRILPFPASCPLHNYGWHSAFYVRRQQCKNAFSVFWNTSAAYRKAIWDEIHFNEAISAGEDREWARRARTRGYEFVYEPQSIVFHCHRESYGRYLRRLFALISVECKLFLGSAFEGN